MLLLRSGCKFPNNYSGKIAGHHNSANTVAMTTHERIMWANLVLCVLYGHLTAQSTTDQCSTDDDNSRQLLLVEQMMSMLQSIGERQVSLLEQMHCTLLSTNRHVKESQVGNVGF